MRPCREQVAERARALVGTPYRRRGKTRSDGLDCAGVAAHALDLPQEAISRADERELSDAELEAFLIRRGLTREDSSEPAAGDLLIFRPGARQLHLAVSTGAAFVHADAGLRRVVERPLPAPWPLVGVWRIAQCSSEE